MIGLSEKGKKTIAFFDYEGRRGMDLINFPWWAAIETWQPNDESSAYFSDETNIYSINHENGTVEKVITAPSFDIRLGKNYSWQAGFVGGKREFFFFEHQESPYKDHRFSSGEKMPHEIDYHNRDRWLAIGDYFVSSFYNQAGELNLFLHEKSKKDYWRKVKFFEQHIGYHHKVSLKPRNSESFYLQINECWYVISLEEAKAARKSC